MPDQTAIATVRSPFGRLGVEGTETEIVALHWGAEDRGTRHAPLIAAIRQLEEYFAGTRTRFELPLHYGEGFQARFLAALSAIPFGETREYGDLARDLDVPPQAIGQACGANRIPILIPCHRVLAASGLGGFSAPGGIETKVALLKHEGAASLLI